MKISELTAASVLDGAELTPVVQSGVTKRSLISAICTYLLGLANSWTAIQSFTAGTLSEPTNPTVGGDPALRSAMKIHVIYDSPSNAGATFSTATGGYIELTSNAGQNVYGGGTNAKRTFAGLSVNHTAIAAGQRFAGGFNMTSYGMGDAFSYGQVVTFGGANIAGDEGTGFSPVSICQQLMTLCRASITSIPTQATINTTTTQTITASITAQTVTVASSTGVIAGQWVVVGQEIPSGTPNLEAVEVTAVAAGSITGIFMNNHVSGVTVTPAKFLRLNTTYQFGEQRVLVNLSGASYSTGTVGSISGGGFIGSGTSWSNSMVGGTASNIGAIALTADDYSGLPFAAAPDQLKSWYQINTVASGTSLGIHTWSVASDAAYRGQGVGAGAYIIRPAMRILRVFSDAVICETSAHTWTVGDVVECVIAPYPDVSGFQFHMNCYTNGGTYRAWTGVANKGSRTFDDGILFLNEMQAGGGADTLAFKQAINVTGAHGTSLRSRNATVAAISLTSEFGGSGTDTSGKIDFNGPYIMPNTANFGMDLRMIMTGNGLDLKFISHYITGKTLSQMKWAGAIKADGWFELPVYTVSGAPSAATCAEGAMIYVSNGNAGSKCMAVSDGTNWKVVALGATIS